MSAPGPNWSFEERFGARVAGVDEAGRGCLAGPVTAAAVILPHGLDLAGLNDSKRLSARRRAELEPEIKRLAIAWAVGTCAPAEIDRLNILHAAMEAMRRALAQLDPPPDAVLFDGNRAFSNPGLPFATVIGGDGKCVSIAAASILAKTARDRAMQSLGADWPAYDWPQNKGYPTAGHYAALARVGPCMHHRRSFSLSRAGAIQHELFEPA